MTPDGLARAVCRHMIYQVSRNGKLIGEFSETMMNHKLCSGELRPEDLCWREGMAGWQTMSEYCGVARPNALVLTKRNQFPSSETGLGIPLVIDLPAALGFSGSLILLLGVFAPAVSVPLLGSVNYLQNGRGAGAILIVTALASAFLSARRWFWRLWISGAVTMICLAASLLANLYEIRRIKESAGRIQDSMLSNLTSAAADAVQLEWGLAVLFVGGVVLLVAAAVGSGKMRIVR